MPNSTRSWRRIAATSLWAALALASDPALAETNSPARMPSPTAQSATPKGAAREAPLPTPDADTIQAAAAAYAEAEASYANGDVQAALDGMRRSYQLTQSPELLYNLAQLEQELNECRRSLEDYRLYLQRVARGAFRQRAKQESEKLELECGGAHNLPPQAVQPGSKVKREPLSERQLWLEVQSNPPPLAARYPYWTLSRKVAWSALAGGVIAGGVSLYFEFKAKGAREDAQGVVDSQARLDPSRRDLSRLDQRQRDLHRDQAVAELFTAAAAALITGGSFVLLVDSSKGTDERTVVPIAVAASFRGRF